MSITLAIIVITVIISLQAFNNPNILASLRHHPYSEHHNKEYYRLLSSGFIHGSSGHLMINMFVLYMFGSYIEAAFNSLYGDSLGKLYYVFLYLTAIAIGDLPTHFRYKNNYNYAAVGASGATSALVLIYCLLDPWSWFLYPPVPAIVFAAGYLFYSHWADSKNKGDGIGHSAHLYGAIYGVLFIVLTKPAILKYFLSKIMEGPIWPPPFF